MTKRIKRINERKRKGIRKCGKPLIKPNKSKLNNATPLGACPSGVDKRIKRIKNEQKQRVKI